MSEQNAVRLSAPFWRQLTWSGSRSALLGSVGGLLLLAAMLWLLPKILPSGELLKSLGHTWLPDNSIMALLVFIGGGSLLTFIGLPRQNLSMVAGFFFGTWSGVLYTLLAVTLASAALYELGHGVARPWVLKRFPAQVSRIDAWANDRLFARVLALRLFPVGSNLVMSLAAGVASAHRTPFITASFIGFIPQTVVFALAGHGVNTSDPIMFAFAVILLVVSVMTGLVFGLNKRQKTEL